MSHLSESEPGPRGSTSIHAIKSDERAEELRGWDRRLALGFALLVFVVALPFIAWQLRARREVRLAVVDKTIPHRNWQEHGALFWWLNHDRRRPVGHGRWEEARDYTGYDPVTRRGTLLTDSALAGRSLLYVADAYGVYSGDYRDTSKVAAGAPRSALEHSRMLFGGVRPEEALAMQRFAAGGGAVVAEFNTLESPTSGTAAAGIVEGIVGARYLGWLGRWYRDLGSEDEIPPWMRARFERRYRHAWDFRGPGIVVFDENSDAIAVVDAAHLSREEAVTLDVTEPDDALVRGVRSGHPSWYWFSGVAPAPGAKVLATYTLHVDSVGARRLGSQGFPTTFPAIVRSGGPALGAYLAGDFADVGGAMPRYQRAALLDWWRALHARWFSRPGQPYELYWNVVVRVWANIIEEAERTAAVRLP